MRSSSAKYFVFILLLSMVSGSVVYSQDLYQIKGATVVIELDYGDSIVQLQSKHLHVQLDNDNAEFKSKLELTTLNNTKYGSQALINITNDIEVVEMKGRFKVDHIETSNHAVLQFEFSGVLTQEEVSIPIYGSAELQHIGGGGSVSCMLGYSFEIDKNTLRANNIGNPNLQKVKVQVLQIILNTIYNK